MYRLKQFFAALRAEISPTERQWVEDQLPSRLRPLFFGMDIVDQRHCLDVAATALANASPDIERDLLTHAALLHDCGKLSGDMTILERGMVVIVRAVFGDRALAMARRSRTDRGWRHALWVQHYHPARGAWLAHQCGASPDLVALIRDHHRQPGPASRPEQLLLYQADQAN